MPDVLAQALAQRLPARAPYGVATTASLTTSLPGPQVSPGVVADANGATYVCGSSSINDTTGGPGAVQFSADGTTVTTLPNMPGPKAAPAAAVDGSNRVYVLGGYAGGVLSPATYRYDPVANSWTTVAAMPVGLSAGATATDSTGRVYYFGGAQSGGSASTYAYRYDPSSNAWTALLSMPTLRGGHSAVTVGNYIYIFGGYDDGGTGATTNWRYDLVANTYLTTLAPLLTARSSHAAAADTSGRIYVIGGVLGTAPTSNSPTTATVDRYDPTANTWTTLTTATLSVGRARGGAGRDGLGRIAVLGGSSSNSTAVAVLANERITPESADAALDTTTGTTLYQRKVRVLQQYLAATDPIAYASAKRLPATVAPELWASPSPVATNPSNVIAGAATVSGGFLYLLGPNCQRYNISTGAWTTMSPNWPSNRTGLAAGYDTTGRIYALGGAPNDFASYRYIPTSNTWESLPSTVSSHQFGTGPGFPDSAGRLYLMGGTDTTNSTTIAERFNPATSVWDRIANMLTARSEFACGMDAQGRIYTAGGNVTSGGGTGTPLATAERYDPTTNTWTALPNMPIGRNAVQGWCDAVGRFYVVGGTLSGTIAAVTTVHRYDPITNSWSTMPPLPQARYRFQSAIDRTNNVVYVIDGSTGNGTGALTSTDVLTLATVYNPVPVKALTAAGGSR